MTKGPPTVPGQRRTLGASLAEEPTAGPSLFCRSAYLADERCVPIAAPPGHQTREEHAQAAQSHRRRLRRAMGIAAVARAGRIDVGAEAALGGDVLAAAGGQVAIENDLVRIA